MGLPPCSIRPGRLSDVERCVELALLAAPERDAREWRASLARDLEDADRRLVVAERDGAVVAYGRARRFEPASDAPADTAPAGYYLTGVYVEVEYRRHGLATALTRARLEWIGRHAAEAWCFTNARNAASIDLHRRLGFEEVTRRFSFPGVAFEGGEGILFRLRPASA